MTEIEIVQALVGNDAEATDSVVAVYLSAAENAIINRRYPYEVPETPDISKYADLKCRLAARYFLRRGAEGELSHSENGISRSYGSVNDEDLLREVTPFAKVV